ncbi:MAG: hypothetical protein AAF581_11215 [Planctomycetota bacterium]
MRGNIEIPDSYTLEHYDAAGVLLHEESGTNLVTGEGRNHLGDILTQGEAAPGSFYVGLLDDSVGPTLSVSDTYATHGGWAEAPSNAYSQATRPAWQPAATVNQQILTSSPSEFSITNGPHTITGAFVATNSTKADSAASGAWLWSVFLFSGGSRPVNTGDTLRVSYSTTMGLPS